MKPDRSGRSESLIRLARGGLAGILAAGVLVAATVAASPAAAQMGVGVGLRVGTAGAGADVGVALPGPFTLRAGVGTSVISAVESRLDNIPYRVEFPSILAMAGVDVALLGPLRLSGGAFWRSEGFTGEAEVAGSTNVGDEWFSGEGTLRASLDGERRLAPYAGFGFGNLGRGGWGVHADLAVAFIGRPTLKLEAEGPITEHPTFQEGLERERVEAEDDIRGRSYTRFWPILSVGVKVPIWGG
ncbi:MAG: hypothetical protein WEA09_03870 [Gemmatimonadota bacterium]